MFSFLPKSNFGKLSVFLVFIMLSLYYLGVSMVDFYSSISAGKTILSDIMARPGVALPMLSGFITGIAAFFCGIISVVKNKDYAVLVFFSTFVGFMVFLWIFVEILFSH